MLDLRVFQDSLIFHIYMKFQFYKIINVFCWNRVPEGNNVMRILRACEKTPSNLLQVNEIRVLRPQVFPHCNCSWNMLAFPSQVYLLDISLLYIIHHSCLLLLIYMPLWKSMLLIACALPVPCTYDCSLYSCDFP